MCLLGPLLDVSVPASDGCCEFPCPDEEGFTVVSCKLLHVDVPNNDCTLLFFFHTIEN